MSESQRSLWVVNPAADCQATVFEWLIRLVTHLAERQRSGIVLGYDANHDPIYERRCEQVDTQRDVPICLGGSFNKTVKALDRAHPCVYVEMQLARRLQTEIQDKIIAWFAAQYREVVSQVEREAAEPSIIVAAFQNWPNLVEQVVTDGPHGNSLTAACKAEATDAAIKAIGAAITALIDAHIKLYTMIGSEVEKLGLRSRLLDRDVDRLKELSLYRYPELDELQAAVAIEQQFSQQAVEQPPAMPAMQMASSAHIESPLAAGLGLSGQHPVATPPTPAVTAALQAPALASHHAPG